MFCRRILISLIMACCALLSGGQIQFRCLPHNSKLSSNMINSIFQDDAGFMYIGTATGLNRYDGYGVEVFRNKKDGPLKSLDNYIKTIQKAPDGRLWIETGKDYAIFDPLEERFDDSIDQMMEQIGVKGTPGMVMIADDRYWVYVRGVGLWTYVDGQDKAVWIEDPNGLLIEEALTDLKMINNSQCMAVNLKGDLILIDVDSKKVARKYINPFNASRANSFFCEFVDDERNIWIYSEVGTWIFDINGGGWKSEYHNTPLDFPMVKNIIQDGKGNIWLGLDHDGIIVVSPSGEVQKFKSITDDYRTLSSNGITALYEDSAGTMWVGTRKSGVAIYNEEIYKFGFMPYPDVNCIIPAGDDKILAGTDNEGIFWQDMTNGAKEHYKTEFSSTHDTYAIVCMTPASDGYYWIGTYNGGLMKWKPGTVKRYTRADGLASNHIWSIIENPDKSLMLATLGSGLQIFNPLTGESEVFTVSNSGIGSDYVNSFAPAADGKLYVGTSWGLSLYDPATKKITSQMGNRKGDQDFSNPNINQAYADSRGLIWLATYSGLNAYDPVRDVVYIPDCGQLGAQDYVGGVIEDPNGQIWATAGNMLIKVKVDVDSMPDAYRFETQVFDENSGLPGYDFSQRSLCMLPDGMLLVGGLNGINYFYPSRLEYTDNVPSVFFTKLLINNQEITPGEEYDGSVVLDRSIRYSDELEFSSAVNDFTIGFASDNFYNSDNVKYVYRLLGYSNEWISLSAGSLPQVTYTNLPPGNYELQVKAIGSNGIVPDAAAKMKIHVAPPFYLTIWAFMLYVVMGVVLIYVVVRMVKSHERKRFDVRKREELAKKQEELNQMKFKFFTNISHELRTPLTLISAPVEALLKRENDETSRRQLSIIQANSARLLNLVNQLLDFRKNEMSGLTLQASSGDLVSFVRSLCDSFLMFSEKKGINFSITANPDSIQMDFDEDKMGKIVMNLLSNAFKFTPDGGEVDVDIYQDGKVVCLKVSDTGIGISGEDKKHIFDRFYQASESLNGHIAGTGIGLSLVWEYAHLHGGDVEVADNPGGGTVFLVTIPIRHEASSAQKPVQESESAPEEALSEPDNGLPTVLLVDDNSDLLDFISSELAADYNVITARDGIEALEALKQRVPDMIISDIMMPEMDGIELCRRLKSDAATASIPLLLLTAKHDVAAKIEGLTLGADDYMTKPFNMDVLRLRLKKMMALRKKGMQRPMIEVEPEPIAITSLDEQLIEKAVKYVEKHMDNPELTVEEMASEMGMSRVHLYKRLKQLTGKTPIEFIRVLRLKRAAQMLRESQLNVSEIAYQCGFNNPKYFAKYFKNEFGMNPSEYQETEDITNNTPKHNI